MIAIGYIYQNRIINYMVREHKKPKINRWFWERMYKPLRPKKNTKYVSGSALRNKLLNDPLLDWLKQNSMIRNQEPSQQSSQHSSQHSYQQSNIENILFEKGNEFESYIENEIKKKFPNEWIKICNSHHDLDDNHVILTFNHMVKGTPIIFQAPVINKENRTRGILDILIRSDYINKLVPDQIDDYDSNIRAPKLTHNYHYRVIDIKWSQLPLCVDGKRIRNSDSVPAYKGQLCLYNCALGKMQGYYPDEAYILGRGYKIDTKEKSNDPFKKLGHIEFEKWDNQYIERTAEAIKWRRELDENGHQWSVDPPSNPNLYPNMCNNNDEPYHQYKKEIADNIKELTSIWNVGYEHRLKAHANNVYRYDDPNCNSSVLQINGKKGEIIDKILDVTRSDKLYYPEKISDELLSKLKDTKDDLYIDFETIEELFMSGTNGTVIFMIGCGYIENEQWQFKQFIMSKYTQEDEIKILNQFIDFVMSRTTSPKLYHWSNAEISMLNSAINKYQSNTLLYNKLVDFMQRITSIDLCNIFTYTPIIIKGALNFKLKTIMQAMYNNGFIKTNANSTNNIDNGLIAMTSAINYYRSGCTNTDIINNIAEYNHIDCKVMYEIKQFLCSLN